MSVKGAQTNLRAIIHVRRDKADFSREELAREIGVSVDQLDRWLAEGPPGVAVGVMEAAFRLDSGLCNTTASLARFVRSTPAADLRPASLAAVADAADAEPATRTALALAASAAGTDVQADMAEAQGRPGEPDDAPAIPAGEDRWDRRHRQAQRTATYAPADLERVAGERQAAKVGLGGGRRVVTGSTEEQD